MQDEILDLVNEEDEVIGTIPRSEAHEKNLHNFRVVNLFVINDKGELWIPRRTKEKRLYPNALDMSMGGHVESGETYEQALVRETSEELNLELTKIPYRLLGKLTPHEHGVHCFQSVYEVKLNEAPKYNPHDYSEYFWMMPKDLLQKIADGEPAKSDLPILVKYFFPQ